jgi:quercetin dioxygenase-like cupin family protein
LKPSREDLIRTGNARVAAIGLAAGEASPWHHHTRAREYLFCLHGSIEVRLSGPVECHRLQPGERCDIEPRRPHCLVNPGGDVAGYLLVQHGDYDYVRDEA